MNFYIKQNSSSPKLAVEFETNGYTRLVETDFFKRLQNASITFSMQDGDKCYYTIKCKEADLLEIEDCKDKNCAPKFVLSHTFTTKETRKKGVYLGEFTILFNDNGEILRLPIKRELKINII